MLHFVPDEITIPLLTLIALACIAGAYIVYKDKFKQSDQIAKLNKDERIKVAVSLLSVAAGSLALAIMAVFI